MEQITGEITKARRTMRKSGMTSIFILTLCNVLVVYALVSVMSDIRGLLLIMAR